MSLFESFERMIWTFTVLVLLYLVSQAARWVTRPLYDLYYFVVLTPRVRKNLKAGDSVKLGDSGQPAKIINVGDRYAWVHSVGIDGSKVERSVSISNIYPPC